MLKLSDVANKLQNILNGIDAEAGNSPLSDEFYFKVETEGFHLDSIAMVERYERKNFIPVFVGVIGGEYNPIPTMVDENITLPISIYVPIRFKAHMYDLNNFLVQTFVGANLHYGDNKAISNMGVATFSEMEQSSLKQFREWVSDVYDTPIELDDNYFLMEFNLYLADVQTKTGTNVLFGNELTKIHIKLLTPDESVQTRETDALVIGFTTSYQAEPVSQQIIGENMSKGIEQTSAVTLTFTMNIRDNNVDKYILKHAICGELQGRQFYISINAYESIMHEYLFYCSSALVNWVYGEPVSIAFVFARRIGE